MNRSRFNKISPIFRGFGQGRKRPISWVALAVFTLLLTTIGVPTKAQMPPDTHGRENSADLFSQTLTPSQALQQGTQQYQAGQWLEAATLWQQAVQGYQRQGEILHQAQGLNYLSLVYQDLGEWNQAREAIAQSLSLLQGQTELEPRGVALFAQALNNQGQWQLATGQTEAALESWIQAQEAYKQAGNEPGMLGSQIDQAQALQALGQYRRARTVLGQVNQQLQSQPDSRLKADGLRSLGRALQTAGDLVQAKAMLEQSWAISQRLGATADTGATLFSIGNIARDLRQYDAAFSYYQEASDFANRDLDRVQAQLNQLSLLVEWCPRSGDRCPAEELQALLSQIQAGLATLSPSRASVYARVNFAESLMSLKNSPLTLQNPQWQFPEYGAIAQILATAVRQGQDLGDRRSVAYALTQMGKLYEQTQQWQEAARLSQQALQMAGQIDAGVPMARSAWQLGRILKQQGDLQGAIGAYQIAFETLQSLRSDLVTINSEVQFEFKESVEPIYREFISLLLQPNATQSHLKQARDAIEALQLAELDNFFQEACLETRPVQIETLDPQAAVIYPIILPDRLEVILSLPDRPLHHYTTQLSSTEIDRVLQQLYSSLYLGYSGNERLQLAEQVYNWLIRSAEADLADQNIKTLVFVLDGFLRNLPMGALYDGKHYLVENYSIALSPGLQLFPEALERGEFKALTVGLTEARQGFSALPGVEVEVKQIASEVEAQVLLDREFTRSAFQNQIEAGMFGVVHLATHGQFSSNPEETFLLTWDEKIQIEDFDRFLKGKGQGTTPIELLVLSACQTASGDRRATLGLAGLAVRSGARSTLATLWSVSDRSTAELMARFYDYLTESNTTITKAEALRQAQLTLMQDPRYNHPYFWAPFVLVGNWL